MFATAKKTRSKAEEADNKLLVGLGGLTCQRTGGYRPPGAKSDGEDPNQHFRAADLSLLHDERSHRHNIDGLHLHISAAGKLG